MMITESTWIPKFMELLNWRLRIILHIPLVICTLKELISECNQTEPTYDVVNTKRDHDTLFDKYNIHHAARAAAASINNSRIALKKSSSPTATPLPLVHETHAP